MIGPRADFIHFHGGDVYPCPVGKMLFCKGRPRDADVSCQQLRLRHLRPERTVGAFNENPNLRRPRMCAMCQGI
jgi:hypothetical protein